MTASAPPPATAGDADRGARLRVDADEPSRSERRAAVAPPILLRRARRSDGPAIWRLVRDSGVLDVNTPYAYLLLADHFAGTCVVAERGDGGRPDGEGGADDGGDLLGFVAGYVLPDRPEVVFVWQVGVAEAARGRGLGLSLLVELLRSPACRAVWELQATVTPDNEPSRRLFRALAREMGCRCDIHPDHLPRDLFPGEGHQPEDLFVVGPLPVRPNTATDPETP